MQRCPFLPTINVKQIDFHFCTELAPHQRLRTNGSNKRFRTNGSMETALYDSVKNECIFPRMWVQTVDILNKEQLIDTVVGSAALLKPLRWVNARSAVKGCGTRKGIVRNQNVYTFVAYRLRQPVHTYAKFEKKHLLRQRNRGLDRSCASSWWPRRNRTPWEKLGETSANVHFTSMRVMLIGQLTEQLITKSGYQIGQSLRRNLQIGEIHQNMSDLRVCEMLTNFAISSSFIYN